MATLRDQRNLPLTLTADAINTNVVRAFDWAAGDGVAHVGTHTLTKTGTLATVAVDAHINGKDGTNLLANTDGWYGTTGGVNSLGMNVGTGDFGWWRRFRTPSVPPSVTATNSGDVHEIARLTDNAGTILSVLLAEIANGFYAAMILDHTGGIFLNYSSGPQFDANTVFDVYVTRVSGTMKAFVNGVEYASAANSRSWSGTGGGTTFFGVNNTTAKRDVVVIDEMFWNGTLTDAQVADHAANPYYYYTNSAAANSIAITEVNGFTSLGGGVSVPKSFTISGTIAGGGVPKDIEARLDSGSWQTIQTGYLTGSTFSGVFDASAETPGSGKTLNVRWKSDTAASTSLASVTLLDATIAVTSPVTYQVVQRTGRTRFGDIAITGTYSGTDVPDGSALEASFNGGAYQTIAASISGGTFSGTLTSQTVGQGTLTVRRVSNTSAARSVPTVGVGVVYIVGGQSNHSGRASQRVAPPSGSIVCTEYAKDSTWKPLQENVISNTGAFDDNASWIFSTADTAGRGSYFGWLAQLIVNATSMPVALVPNALGSTGATQWAAGANHHDLATLYGAMLTRAEAVGAFEALLWCQGENDSNTDLSTANAYQAKLETFVDNWFADTGKKVVICRTTNNTLNATWSAIVRAAQVAVCNSKPTKTILGPDMDLYQAGLHYDTATETKAIAAAVFEKLNHAFYGANNRAMLGVM